MACRVMFLHTPTLITPTFSSLPGNLISPSTTTHSPATGTQAATPAAAMTLDDLDDDDDLKQFNNNNDRSGGGGPGGFNQRSFRPNNYKAPQHPSAFASRVGGHQQR